MKWENIAPFAVGAAIWMLLDVLAATNRFAALGTGIGMVIITWLIFNRNKH